MKLSVALASTALASTLAFAASAAAQDAPAAVSAPPAAADAGAIAYPASYFAASQAANALEMLFRLPGFTLDTGDSIRGFEGGGGNALVDGQRPASKTDPLDELLRRIPAANIERIELIRGGAPGIDMQGKTVVANVVRKAGGGFRGLFAVANNSVYDGRQQHGVRLELSGGKDGRNWEGSARYGYGADDGGDIGPGLRVGPGGTILTNSKIERESDGLAKTLTGAYEQPLLGGKVRFNGRMFWEKWKEEEDRTVFFPSAALVATDDVYLSKDTELGARFTRAFGPRTSLEVIGLRQTKDRDISSTSLTPPDTAFFHLLRESSETIGRGVLKHQYNADLSFELGAEGALNQLDSQTRYLSNGVAIPLPAANVTVEETRGQAFTKASWRASPAWTFEGGLRYEASSISSEGDVVLEKSLKFAKPRLAATWQATPKTQVRLRFERVVGQLNFDDFVADSSLSTGVVTAGNPDLDPEQAWVSEAAVEQRFWDNGVVMLTYRHSALTDAIDRAPIFTATSVYDAPSNIGDGTKDELILNLTVPLERFGLKGAQFKGESIWRQSEVTDPTTGEMREISDLRPLEWEATFSHDLPRWKATWGVDVFGGWRETSYQFNQIHTVKLKTFVKPFVEVRLQPDLLLRVEVFNATERGIRSTRTVYAGPRNTSPIAYVDDRDLQFGRGLYVRLRKTFGG
ncbi:TonB-dependent siderophore receptor [Phenylobacterium sp.]|uniref:TonB-dependent receptor plug domain-containing protein n=1 Tax=Phenylobacterium sp. TaxID=1871053 RepID=UPI002733C5F1|nr:TonB-dependent receptor [Phenylobacterium sp.]MDP3855055.1 TonB-dependent receptor [Phenylobacterium sp.]